MKRIYALLTCALFSSFLVDAQIFPGGVTDAEVWYIADWDDLNNEVFHNFSQTDIEIESCGITTNNLFNFNSSISTDELCLMYTAPLENSTGRDVFFVGEPSSALPIYSHLGTLWNTELDNTVHTDSIIRNFFDVNNQNAIAQEISDHYLSDKNAHINFYHLNHYNIDKKFKSYGQQGETDFFIGRYVNFDTSTEITDESFSGNFPEFISFTREISANERIRVESYLALKYGITLDQGTTYLSARNKMFWYERNSKTFTNRLFGLGRDDISGLNQLQSESSHLKDHLVAAVGKIVETNMQKQALTNIPNEHFLVFGDDGGLTELMRDNQKQIDFWGKTWLAHGTGQKMPEQPIYFKLKLTGEIIDRLTSNSDEHIWMLKDDYVNNTSISDFEGEFIKYYKGVVDLVEGYAYFDKIFFDEDKNSFDQYTFGVGPEMIVQAQVSGCQGDDLTMTIVITGGKPKYSINIESDDDAYDITTSNSTYSIPVSAGNEYEITVFDANGLQSQMTITVEPQSLEVNLGPDQILDNSQSTISLDAGQNIQDPNATYSWYRDGLLLLETDAILQVNEPGLYEVFVTSGDLTCTVSDVILISIEDLQVAFSTISGCSEAYNALTIEIESGFAPYTTILSGPSVTTNYIHTGTITIFDLPYGIYTVEVSDSEGNLHQENSEFSIPVTGLGLDVYPQLEAHCNNATNTPCLNLANPVHPLLSMNFPADPFEIDASVGVIDPNQSMTYEWFQDGQPIGINTPEIVFQPGANECADFGELLFTVVATDLTTNCSTSQSFYTRSICPVLSESYNSMEMIIENTPLVGDEGIEELNEAAPVEILKTLSTKVYPNPTISNAPFTYEVKYPEVFEGTVEVFNRNGELIQRIKIEGKEKYILPIQLDMSGMYLIRTVTSGGEAKTNRIIIN
ncbi:MAG: T9SS type A sorting domain-containing protein [Bacteroidota bacterium]